MAEQDDGPLYWVGDDSPAAALTVVDEQPPAERVVLTEQQQEAGSLPLAERVQEKPAAGEMAPKQQLMDQLMWQQAMAERVEEEPVPAADEPQPERVMAQRSGNSFLRLYIYCTFTVH
jgi:hypothetical protein